MLCSIRRRICYILMCILILNGMYGTYAKADSLAEQAASMEAAWTYTTGKEIASVTMLSKMQSAVVDMSVCVFERIDSVTRTIIGRITSRNSQVRRDIRFFCLFLWALCIAYFLLKCWYAEERLCLHETKYRTTLIKYIHDIDGKKRETCLT